MAPFPYLPMIAIMASLVIYPVVQINVYPYMGYMVEHLGIVDDKDKAGYYAGLLSSAFMIGHGLSAHFWGVVSDRRGTRFVLLVGLSSTVVLSLAFGFSTTLTWAFVTRFLLGLLNGMMAASKTLVSEVCGKEHETVGMGFVTASWTLGGILGPGIGGMLAEPAKHHPHTFSKLGIFGRYPYLLPNVVAPGLALLSLPLVLIFLKGPPQHPGNDAHIHEEKPEDDPLTVMPVIREQARISGPLSYGLDDATTPSYSSTTTCYSGGGGGDDGNEADDGGEAGHAPASPTVSTLPTKTIDTRTRSGVQTETTSMIETSITSGEGTDTLDCTAGDLKQRSLLAQPRIRTLLVINALYALSYCGFNEVYALWSLSTVANGGLDWSTLQIGQVFLTCGLMVLVFDVFAVPNLTPRLGVRLFQRVGSVFEVPVYFLFPVLSAVNSAGLPVAFASLILLFTCYAGSNSMYIGMSLTLNNATEPHRRGELNGIAMVVDAFASAISPVIFSMLFAFSIDGDHPFPFDYHLVFYLIGTIRLAVACIAWNSITDTEGTEKPTAFTAV